MDNSKISDLHYELANVYAELEHIEAVNTDNEATLNLIGSYCRDFTWHDLDNIQDALIHIKSIKLEENDGEETPTTLEYERLIFIMDSVKRAYNVASTYTNFDEE